ncbi:hypothetical protein CBL_08257 [Carabus blaptoides fortunei]
MLSHIVGEYRRAGRGFQEEIFFNASRACRLRQTIVPCVVTLVTASAAALAWVIRQERYLVISALKLINGQSENTYNIPPALFVPAHRVEFPVFHTVTRRPDSCSRDSRSRTKAYNGKCQFSTQLTRTRNKAMVDVQQQKAVCRYQTDRRRVGCDRGTSSHLELGT